MTVSTGAAVSRMKYPPSTDGERAFLRAVLQFRKRRMGFGRMEQMIRDFWDAGDSIIARRARKLKSEMRVSR